jgi:hypothetical protein
MGGKPASLADRLPAADAGEGEAVRVDGSMDIPIILRSRFQGCSAVSSEVISEFTKPAVELTYESPQAEIQWLCQREWRLVCLLGDAIDD